jgi:hypothetical protein
MSLYVVLGVIGTLLAVYLIWQCRGLVHECCESNTHDI